MSRPLATITVMTTSSPVGVVHIAGPDIQVGPLLRQRCGWCGHLLLDYDLTRTASPCAEPCAGGCNPEHHRPATWPPGTLVEVDGNASWTVPHTDGDQLPAQACAAQPGPLLAEPLPITEADVAEFTQRLATAWSQPGPAATVEQSKPVDEAGR